jgi:hypothetical protein
MNIPIPRAARSSLIFSLFLIGGCSSQPRDPAMMSDLRIGQTLRADVLSRYGEPDQIRITQDEEVWVYDGSNPHGSYIDAAIRMQEAMLMPSTTRPATTASTGPTTSPSTNPLTDARRKAYLEATLNLIRPTSRDREHPATFTFDRKTDRLQSFSGSLPPISYGRLMEAGRAR